MKTGLAIVLLLASFGAMALPSPLDCMSSVVFLLLAWSLMILSGYQVDLKSIAQHEKTFPKPAAAYTEEELKRANEEIESWLK